MGWYQRRVHGDRSLNSQRIFFLSLVKNCNHKGLGIYYLLSAFIFGISGTLVSVLIRIELYSSGNRIISPENQNFYNVSITLHGLLMIFFLVMPGLFGGFGNYFVVIFQGSPEVVYPRVNNFSTLILFPSYLLLILSLISEFGGGTGWTLYPPLSTSFMSLSPSSIAFMVFGLLMSGISSCLTSLNFWVTILNLRSYSLTLKTLPLFPWALFITAAMLLLVLPVLTGALLMVLADLHSNTLFFDPVFGGDPVLYQHLFWFFGHPEVYILIIPAFGIVSIIISGILQKIIFGNQSMIFAMSCISLLGSVVWGHHMYTVGLETDVVTILFGILVFFSELQLYYKLSLESSWVYIIHQILTQHILVFSFLLEKSSMDGVYVIFMFLLIFWFIILMHKFFSLFSCYFEFQWVSYDLLFSNARLVWRIWELFCCYLSRVSTGTLLSLSLGKISLTSWNIRYC